LGIVYFDALDGIDIKREKGNKKIKGDRPLLLPIWACSLFLVDEGDRIINSSRRYVYIFRY